VEKKRIDAHNTAILIAAVTVSTNLKSASRYSRIYLDIHNVSGVWWIYIY